MSAVTLLSHCDASSDRGEEEKEIVGDKTTNNADNTGTVVQ